MFMSSTLEASVFMGKNLLEIKCMLHAVVNSLCGLGSEHRDGSWVQNVVMDLGFRTS